MSRFYLTEEQDREVQAAFDSDVPVSSGTAPQKEEFMRHRNLKLVIEKLRATNAEAIEFAEAGVSQEIIDTLVTEINRALVVERNEAYVRGMHDEHDERLGERLPPLPARRT